MTCKELRWYFEDHLRDAEVRCARGAVAEHAATCPDCNRLVAELRELGTSLRQVRESVGPVPQSVDTSVLLNYRRRIADRGTRPQMAIHGMSYPRLAWGVAALATALLVIAGLVMGSRHSPTDGASHATTAPTNTNPAREAANNIASASRLPASGAFRKAPQ